ncbi:methyltransferase domain-containing protein [Candidatus Altiarchaeota archaeon]
MLSKIKGFIRLFYRDFVLWVSDVSMFFDENVTVRFLSGTGNQYFWSRIDVHKTLLGDEIRLEVFRKAINEAVKDGDAILDLGAGTGVLSFFAHDAGAKTVYALDSATVINIGRKAAQKMGVEGIRFLRSDVRDLEVSNVDGIISELIGMEIVDEGIMEKMRMAGKALKDGGFIMPAKMEVMLAPVSSTEAGLGFWRKMHGIDYGVVAKIPSELRNFEAGDGTIRLAQDVNVFTVDLADPPKRVEFEHEFTIENEGVFTGCLMYFRAHLSENVVLSTAPEEPLTHWKQIFVPHDKRESVKPGDKVTVKMKTVTCNTKWKWDITIH